VVIQARADEAARQPLRRALGELTRTVAWGAVACADDDLGTWSAASGLADVVAGRPPGPADCFRAGSIVKTLVAITVLQLAGENRLRLGDPVQRWLPGLVPNGDTITIRQLLNHTSGLYNFTEAMPVRPRDLVSAACLRSYPPRELVRMAGTREPYFAPGAGWHYSNTNYVIAGMLIEQVTGRPYGKEVRQRILAPLGLRHTCLPGTSPFLPGPHLRAYLWPGQAEPRSPIDITVQNPSRAWASGELISTAADLTRLLAELLAGRLLAPDEMTELLTTVPGTNGRDYGLGLFRMPLPDGTCAWGSSGAYGGYLTFALRSGDRSRGLTISITPRSDAAMDSVMRFIRAFFCPADHLSLDS
jgi:D-alanyl-D-alanine carboxypeptidase